jgi:GH25 family lysozyme M1 (1,4-beta-N-acetylmuramidase)
MEDAQKKDLAARELWIRIGCICSCVLLLAAALAVTVLLMPAPGPTEPTPAPTLPPPPANPYGPNDFQYDGDYLTCLKGKSRLGIDVSYYQGTINWQQVADAGIEFAMIRVGYRGYGVETGTIQKDTKAERNLSKATAAGLDVGVYFFSQAITVEEAIEEADFVLEQIAPYEITMPVVFDWEWIGDTARTSNMDADTLTACALAFCRRIESAGYRPMIYFNKTLSQNYLHLEALTDYPFWLAMYTDRMNYPYKVDMWQYTNQGTVPGIRRTVDLNLQFIYEDIP